MQVARFFTIIHMEEPTLSRVVSNVTTAIQRFSHTQDENTSFPHVYYWKTWNSSFMPLSQKRLRSSLIIHLKRTS